MQHCFCNSYFYVIFQVLFLVRSEYDTFFFTAHLYIKQFSFNNRVIIVADLTAFYRIVGVSSSININRKNKRKKNKTWKNIGTLSIKHIFANACALFFFVFCTFCQFNNLWVKLFFYLQSNRSLCQGSGVKTTAAVVFTPQLRSSGWTLWAQMSSK